MYYVEIIGPYDCTYVGPFTNESDAATFEASVPKDFNSDVLTQAEMDYKQSEFGRAPIQAPWATTYRAGDPT